jgi:hypothetical protein
MTEEGEVGAAKHGDVLYGKQLGCMNDTDSQ